MTADIFASLSYCPESGELRWIRSSPRTPAGTVAGCATNRGYISVRIRGREYKAHRVAWLLAYGDWPKGDIDHINGVKSDNRLLNLRDVSRSVNCQNKKTARRDSSTGVLGVTKSGRLFRALIQVNGRPVRLGSFATVQEASVAYLLAKRQFHEGNTI